MHYFGFLPIILVVLVMSYYELRVTCPRDGTVNRFRVLTVKIGTVHNFAFTTIK